MASTSSRRALGACLFASVLAAAGCGGGSWPGQSPIWLASDGVPIVTQAPASAQVPGAAAAPTPPGAVQVAPAVGGDAGLGPPAWVQAGTLMTYYGAAASIAGSYYTYVEDPAGDWKDPVTGKRYKRTNEGDDPQDMPTAAGEAFSQTEVLAVEGTDVVIATTLYSIDLLARQYTVTPMGGSRQAGAVVDGAWVNPDALQQVLATGYGDRMILRGPYVLGNATYDAIAFISKAEGAYQSSAYDLASGALLATNSSTKGADSPVTGNNDNPQGNNQLALTKLAGVRQRALPGMGTPPPGWVVPGKQLTYRGTYTQVNPADPGAGPWVYPMQSAITFNEVGSSWSSFASQTVIEVNGQGQPSQGAGVTGSIGLYWYDPASLAAMSPGDVLDEDPITGARVTVESVDPAGSGTLVTLTTAMNGVTMRAGYDRDSGALLTLELAQAVTGGTIQLQLEG